MLNTIALTLDREQMTVLDDGMLATVTGGDGPVSWFLKKVGELVFECITGRLDDLISAVEEGYEAGR